MTRFPLSLARAHQKKSATLRLLSASCSDERGPDVRAGGVLSIFFFTFRVAVQSRESGSLSFFFFWCRFKTCLLSVASVPSLLAAIAERARTRRTTEIIGIRTMKPGERRRSRRPRRRRSRRPRTGENEAKHRRREIHSRFRDSVTVLRRFQSADGFCGLPKVKRSERV